MSKLDVKERLTVEEQKNMRKYGIPCRCACACTVRHRYGAVCALCRDKDHYVDLASYLVQVEARRSA